MKDSRVHVNVVIEDIKVINGSYATYGILLGIIRGIKSQKDKPKYDHKVYKRFSEFWDLKKNLEKEFCGELPYDFPKRDVGFWPKSSLDSSVLEERKVKLTKFLRDLLNDSFDTRWKNSEYVASFLNLEDDWGIVSQRLQAERKTEEKHDEANVSKQLDEPNAWQDVYRECKNRVNQCKNNGYNTNNTKLLMQLRLRINDLDKALTKVGHRHHLSTSDLEKHKNLLNLLRTDINELVTSSNPILDSISTSRKETNDLNISSLFPVSKAARKPLVGRRRLGETEQTIGFNNQQMLQTHKERMQEQDSELQELQKIVQRQKQISVEMNDELSQQNELLHYMDEEASSTSGKLHRANMKLNQFNNDN